MSLNTSTPSFSGGGVGMCSTLCEFPAVRRRSSMSDGVRPPLRSLRVSAEQSSSESLEGRGRERESGRGFTSPAMEVTTLDTFNEAEFPVWDKIGAVVRVSYGIGQSLSISLTLSMNLLFLYFLIFNFGVLLAIFRRR